jgi:predicted ATPase
MLKVHMVNQPHTCWECRSVSYFENTALFPLTDLFQRLLRFHAEETPDEKLGKLEQMLSRYRLPVEESLQLLAPLLSIPLPEHHYPPLTLSPQRQRQKTLETLVAILLELAEHQPVLFIVEDLHWTDPTTLELIGLLLDQIPTASLLMLLTRRPHFQPSWHHRSYLTEMTVHRLPHTQVEQIVTGITDGKTFPAEVLRQIMVKTDGVPLFVEEITKAILESGQLTVVDGHYALTGALSTLAIPATLQDSLMSRLDRLVTAKAVAQYAAVIGRQFSYELLQAVSQLDEATLQRELARLVEAELVFQRGLPPQVTYIFKHALVADAAYQSLLKSTRQHYHQRIAQVLEAQFPETAETQPELLAHHCTEAGLAEQALHYWHTTAQSALQHSAYQETRTHCAKGLEVLETLSETPSRGQQELGLQTILASALHAFGPAHPALAPVFNRTWQLCQQVDNPPQVIPVLRGLSSFYNAGAQYDRAYEVGQRLLALAQQQHDPACLLEAYRALGTATLYRGDVAETSQHFENALALYASHFQGTQPVPQYAGIETGVCCIIYSAHALWFRGYGDQARVRLHHGQQLAEASPYPFTRTWTLTWAARAAQVRREVQLTLERAEAGLALAEQHGFAGHIPQGRLLRGWARTMQDRSVAHVAQMQQQLAALEAMGTKSVSAYARILLAEALCVGEQREAALAVLTEALQHMETTNEQTFQAEAYRLKGELLLARAQDHHEEAAICLHQALRVARQQQIKSWELRAAMSLSRLWQQQGKQAEARALLAPVYGWFTEGFDTADLQEAKALLEELGV